MKNINVLLEELGRDGMTGQVEASSPIDEESFVYFDGEKIQELPQGHVYSIVRPDVSKLQIPSSSKQPTPVANQQATIQEHTHVPRGETPHDSLVTPDSRVNPTQGTSYPNSQTFMEALRTVGMTSVDEIAVTQVKPGRPSSFAVTPEVPLRDPGSVRVSTVSRGDADGPDDNVIEQVISKLQGFASFKQHFSEKVVSH